jgi:hypothetical protein
MATKNGKPSKTAKPGKAVSFGKHTDAMVAALKNRDDIDWVKKEMLLGLSRAWDIIEQTGNNTHTIPSISRELREIWDTTALPDDGDIFE